jgi:hypothetical protein
MGLEVFDMKAGQILFGAFAGRRRLGELPAAGRGQGCPKGSLENTIHKQGAEYLPMIRLELHQTSARADLLFRPAQNF